MKKKTRSIANVVEQKDRCDSLKFIDRISAIFKVKDFEGYK